MGDLREEDRNDYKADQVIKINKELNVGSILLTIIITSNAFD